VPRSSLLRDAEHNRNLVMATDPAKSGPLTVKMQGHAHHTRPSDLPKPGDIDYLVDVYIEGRDLVFRFDIPKGAPRTHRQVSRNGVTRPVLIGSEEDVEGAESPDGIVNVSLRMPSGLHTRLTKQASREQRSLHGQILHKLEALEA
jgi:hypothetical protein